MGRALLSDSGHVESINKCKVKNRPKFFANIGLCECANSNSPRVRTKVRRPFQFPPGQIVSMRIMFEVIPDIRGHDTNIDKGVPICLNTELFDFKGRHHEFVTHVFQITKGDEQTTEYTSTMQDKGIVALRFSQPWSLLH